MEPPRRQLRGARKNRAEEKDIKELAFFWAFSRRLPGVFWRLRGAMAWIRSVSRLILLATTERSIMNLGKKCQNFVKIRISSSMPALEFERIAALKMIHRTNSSRWIER
jgi:hypothetical protein